MLTTFKEEQQQLLDILLNNEGRDHLNRRVKGETLPDLGNRIKVTCFKSTLVALR